MVKGSAAATETVGRVGELRLEYVRRNGKTVLARSHATTPWHVLPTIYLDDTGQAHTLLINPSAGLVGGDRLSIHMTLREGASTLVSTPSANRVYRSLGEESVQTAKIALGPGSLLEWMPEPTIPFAGARFRQAIHVTLAPGATILLWDAVASGRIARGERWQFESFTNEIVIQSAGGTSVIERYELRPGTSMSGIGLAGEWNYVASLLVIGDGISPDRRDGLEKRIAEYLVEEKRDVLGGVSSPAAGGLAVRILARSAPDLASVQQELWRMIRQDLWGLSAVALRKY